MTIHLYIVTHDHIGQELLKTVSSMINVSDIYLKTIYIPSDIKATQQTEYSQKLNTALAFSSKNDTIILCDIYGATPCNLVKNLQMESNTLIITGLNLGMLIKAVQITHKPLKQAADEIVRSAQKSIILK